MDQIIDGSKNSEKSTVGLHQESFCSPSRIRLVSMAPWAAAAAADVAAAAAAAAIAAAVGAAAAWIPSVWPGRLGIVGV